MCLLKQTGERRLMLDSNCLPLKTSTPMPSNTISPQTTW